MMPLTEKGKQKMDNFESKFMDADKPCIQQLLQSIVVKGNHSITQYSMTPEEAEKFDFLVYEIKKLNAEQFNQLAQTSTDCFSIALNIDKLIEKIMRLKSSQETLELHMRNADWLIKRGASNQLILKICTAVCPEKISTLRQNLNRPVGKGRKPTPPEHISLAIIQIWHDFDKTKNLFECYELIWKKYPDWELGIIHSVLLNEEGY